MVEIGGMDWRFADPSADGLVGFNFSALSASPLVRSLITQLGTSQGMTEADMQKIFDGLSGVDQVAFSIHDNRIVVMITGSVADSPLSAPPAGFKAVPVSASALLVGHADAVDWAVWRIGMKGPLAELPSIAEEMQRNSEFWAVGSPAFVGPQAASAGLKRFSLKISIREQFTSDLAFEFNGVPGSDILKRWQILQGAPTLEGNVLHIRTAMEAGEMKQKFAKITASPLGQGLAALVKSAKYIPVRDPGQAKPAQTKAVIYGLDDGPKQVSQDPH
jgi:hypothetical protein